MTKKLLCLSLAVVMISAMFAINCSAAVSDSGKYAVADFTRPDDQVGNADWKPDGWGIGGRHGLADTLELAISNVTAEGYLELCKGGYVNGGSCIYRELSLPKNFTLMFDVRYPEVSGFEGALFVDCSFNGYRQCVQTGGAVPYLGEDNASLTQGTGGHEANVWYTYVFQVKGDRMSVFKKKTADATFTQYLNNVKMQKRAGNEFYAYSTSPTAYINLDNIKVFSGTGADDLEVGVGETRAFAEGSVFAADVSPLGTKTVTPILAAYDSKGKVLGMTFGEEVFKFNTNDVELELAFGSEVREQLSGGKVEFFICDTANLLKPLTQVYVINVD